MDIHRCRFVPYPTSAINALAFSHASSITGKGKGPPTLRLAIGRANGDIEIWNPLKGAWHQESILRGGKDRSIEGLVWTRDPVEIHKSDYKLPGKLRLFSIGYSTSVTEWDLASGRPIRHLSGSSGELWCIAAQPLEYIYRESTAQAPIKGPQDIQTEYQGIAVGCADGAILLFSTADGDLQLQKVLVRSSLKKARVLSIVFQSRNVLVAGYADSVIRVFDARTGQHIRQMSIGTGPVGGPKDVLIWSVKCLPDGTIVSGDSTGTVRFWDGKNYTLLQRIQSHMADILDIATSADGGTIISGGMDRRTTLYRRIGSGNGGNQRRWAEVTHRRMHSHDIKAMATFESRQLSILVSGGLDTNPIIVPIQEFGREYHRSISSLPQRPPICSAPRRRLIMSWWDRELNLYRVHENSALRHGINGNTGNTDPDEAGSQELVAKIALKGEASLTCADIASDGSMIVASTMSEIKIFRLQTKMNARLRINRVDIPQSIAQSGARMVYFSPDGKWLVTITTDNMVRSYRIMHGKDGRKASRLLPKSIDLERLPRESAKISHHHGSHGNYNRSISRVAFSADSRILAVADLSGYLDIWVLEGYEDLAQLDDADANDVDSSTSSDDDDYVEEKRSRIVLGQHWIRNPAATLIPRLPCAPLIFSFRPPKTAAETRLANGTAAVHPTRRTPHPHSHDLQSGEDRLLALTSEHQIFEFEVLAGRLSSWSRRNPASQLPAEFRTIRDRAMGLIWDINTERERVWIHGSSWLWMFDLSKDFPSIEQPAKEPQQRSENVEVTSSTTGSERRKRKREAIKAARAAQEPVEQDSGAGSKMHIVELGIGIGRKIRRIDGPELSSSGWISLAREYSLGSEDDENNDAGGLALLDLRRGIAEVAKPSNGDIGNVVSDQSGGKTNHNTNSVKPKTRSGVPFWGTHKYRPILGIVLLGGDQYDDDKIGLDGYGGASANGVEVALVERPLFDRDLPPRYHGNQEWEIQ